MKNLDIKLPNFENIVHIKPETNQANHKVENSIESLNLM